MTQLLSTSLGDLCDAGLAELRTGPFGSQLHSYDYVRHGIPVIPTEAIRGRRIDVSVCPRITAHKAKELHNHRLEPGDILFARRGVQATGHIGVVRQAEAGFLCGTGAIRLRLTPNNGRISSDYLSHLLADPASVQWFKFHAIGATMPNLNESIIRSFPLLLPPLDHQLTIASFLSNLDDKIELNQRSNDTLEAMAQAIFRDWFVDFGPVRRKMEGATGPVAIMGGVTNDAARAGELAALFPDALEAELPLGWRPDTLARIAATRGETVAPASLDPKTNYIGLEHMPRRSIALDDWGHVEKVTSQKARFERGQVLFGKLRPYFHKVGIAPVDGVCSTDIVVLDGRSAFDREFVACCASSDAFVAFNDQASSGTKMPRTSWSIMQAFPVALAPEVVRQVFSSMARPLHQKIITNVAENRTLGEIRDYLLPRLMSGEVRVREAEALAQAAE